MNWSHSQSQRRHMLVLPLVPLLSRVLLAQKGGNAPDRAEPEPTLRIKPLPRDLKGDRERNLNDLHALSKIVQELRGDIEATDPSVTSVTIVKRADTMRELAQKIHGRIRADYKK